MLGSFSLVFLASKGTLIYFLMLGKIVLAKYPRKIFATRAAPAAPLRDKVAILLRFLIKF